MSVSEIRKACEGVLNASPSDYEAACEVWTRVCTPQSVLAALPGTCETCSYWEQLDEDLDEPYMCTKFDAWMHRDDGCSRYEPR